MQAANAPRDWDGGWIAGSTVATLVRSVREARGEDGVLRMLELAGDSRAPEEIEDATGWSTYDQVVALFEAGIEVTDDPEFPRHCGERGIGYWEATEVAELLRSLGSPGAVLRNIAWAAPKFSTAVAAEVLEIGDAYAVISIWAIGRPCCHAAFCAYNGGLISRAPVLFGMDPADVVETQCQRRGDERCVYEARWEPNSSPETDPERHVTHLEAQLVLLTERFEALQTTASELASTEGIDTVLTAITRRAGLAVRAPRHLLAISLGPNDHRLHHQGFANEAEARRAAEEILTDHPDAHNQSRLIVDVASGERRFGRLAALYPQGTRFLPAEQRLLEAYAASAAAALKVATALDEARRQRRTAQALLTLASSLAQVGTSDEIAARLAHAVPTVVGCDKAAVLLWDPTEQILHFRAFNGLTLETEASLRELALQLPASGELYNTLAAAEPAVIDDTAEPPVRQLLDTAGVRAAFLTPILAHHKFYGIVAVPLDDPAPPYDHTFEVLRGVTAHAATALHNAQLLEQIRHQALHDELTGLPNRTLLADRVDRALAAASRNTTRVALLFVDLDDFKAVNDRLGHTAGDVLLSKVGQRLTATLRDVDTVARVGGDEFVVLLTELTQPIDAERVANHLLQELRAPFTIASTELRISASVGATVAEADDDYEALLTNADTAMYYAKTSGGDKVSGHSPEAWRTPL